MCLLESPALGIHNSGSEGTLRDEVIGRKHGLSKAGTTFRRSFCPGARTRLRPLHAC